MRWVRREASCRLRFAVLGVVAVLGTLGSHSAHARTWHHARAHHAEAYAPPSAAIVVDGNSGGELYASNADAQRHPASLTKIMTLYLLFERLEAGRIRLDTPLKVSEHASDQAPTKLGLKPGQTIAVEDAIKAVVTKSANDAAVAIAENLGGDEESFARLMTQKARALGMARTTYVNASGLPNDDQLTTARDQALLGRVIQERFPRYYRYFSTEGVRHTASAMRNHNHLLGEGGRRRRHQDRLHPRLRLQPRHLRASRWPLHRRGRAGRTVGRRMSCRVNGNFPRTARQSASSDLDDIPPAPRGVPQIEVSFDIDANGILHVSAKDLGTGKEQKITITASSGLSKDEIERMRRDGELHADEDRQHKEELEARNEADSAVYRTEKLLKDNANKLFADTKTKLDAAANAVRAALKGTDAAAIKTACGELNETWQEASRNSTKRQRRSPVQAEVLPARDPKHGRRRTIIPSTAGKRTKNR